MSRGDIGLGDERPLFTLGGRRLRREAQHVTRDELVDLLPQRREDTFRHLRMLFERLRAANVLAVQSPRAVESTEDRAFDVVLFGLTPAAAAVFFPARALRLAPLPFRVGRLPVAGEAQPLEVNDLQLSDTRPFHVSRDHFAIERGPDGVQVRDRGSYVGTIVNGVQIGGHRHVATVPLAVGENEVVAGSPKSPFRFRVVVALRQPTSSPDHELDLAYRD
jgi:FHA domain-containing protein